MVTKNSTLRNSVIDPAQEMHDLIELLRRRAGRKQTLSIITQLTTAENLGVSLKGLDKKIYFFIVNALRKLKELIGTQAAFDQLSAEIGDLAIANMSEKNLTNAFPQAPDCNDKNHLN